MDDVLPFLVLMWVLIGGAWLADKAMTWADKRGWWPEADDD